MCGRTSLTLTEKQLEKELGRSFYSDEINRYNPLPNFNIAPTHYLPVITNEDPTHFQYYKWGLLPHWARDEKYGSRLINARIESVDQKASFKSSFQKRRCLIPMSGYYEWLNNNGMRHPYRIINSDLPVFLVAGLWNIWTSPAGHLIPTFTIITRDAAAHLAYIHDRMPAILPHDHAEEWLLEDQSPAFLKELIFNLDAHNLKAYPVSSKINSVYNNDASLIEEVQPPEIQQTLF